MNTPAAKLAAYTAGLVALVAGAVGIGQAVGPLPTAPTPVHSGHGNTSEAQPPGGLQSSQNGYTLVAQTTTVTPGKPVDFRFTVTGPDGAPVTDYTPTHDKKLHFIVVRRDMTGFQHLHPTELGNGTWAVRLTLPTAGPYRAFADFAPHGARQAMTLGMDLSAPGAYQPRALPAPSRSASVDGYTLTLDGELRAGRSSRLTFTVSRNGTPVADLQPYLAAYGHLVVLRADDLAYLHVHPDGAPGDNRTTPGPQVTFFAEVPGPGPYRLFLDFQHQNTVRTAEFTAVATGDGGTPQTPSGGHNH
jgi:hypothetical protein